MSKELQHDQLPPTVRGFVDGWQTGRVDEVEALFAEDAVVSDEGRTYRGRDEIRSWIVGSIDLFTTTITFLRAREVDGMIGVSYHLEGDFPGGAVDLEYQFRLDGAGRIERLDFDVAAG